MASFRLTPAAQADLVGIRSYTIKEWGAEQSKKYLGEIRKTIQLLAENPVIGHKKPDVADGMYSFPHASHVIYYLIHDEQLVVFAVLHKSMVPNKHLEDRDLI